MKSKHWHTYHLGHISRNIPYYVIKLFYKISQIRKTYFSSNIKKPQLSFTLSVRTLDQRLKSLQFLIGNQSISYKHGPIVPISFNWPFPSNLELCKIIITNFNGRHYMLEADGPWCLFKLLDKNSLPYENSNSTTVLKISLNHYNATFNLGSSKPFNAFRLKLLKGFHLANKL